MSVTKLRFHWRAGTSRADFRSAVSLHGHTLHSRECLDVVCRYALRIPLFSRVVKRELDRYETKAGSRLALERAYWTPPLSGPQALGLEAKQIEERLGLNPLVSLTDHDDIQAAELMLSVGEAREVPVSFEWTVPFGPTFFHVGVHNLPRDEAPRMFDQLCAYKDDPRGNVLGELFQMLHENRETLVIFNHPLWNLPLVAPEKHTVLMETFLQQYGRWLHALELNGLRPWKENMKVVEIARGLGKPVVSGGDRHGFEPAAALNLSRATTFAEFAVEVREEGISEVLLMPQYLEPLRLRWLETAWDVIGDYPEHTYGRHHWNERVYFVEADGVSVPVRELLPETSPAPVRYFLAAMKLTRVPQIRSALRFAFSEREVA